MEIKSKQLILQPGYHIHTFKAEIEMPYFTRDEMNMVTKNESTITNFKMILNWNYTWEWEWEGNLR